MLEAIGVRDFEELLSNIPDELRFKGSMHLPEPLSEFEVANLIQEMAKRNDGCNDYITFIGGGAYDHYIPAAVDHIISRSEFYTAYTPYQPEVSQGTLQAIYEYQSMITELTGMEVSNASLYDGGSALAEAVLMAIAETGRKKVLISKAVNPFYRSVISTYLSGQGVSMELIDCSDGTTNPLDLKKHIDGNTAAMVIQHPNFFGCLEEMPEFEAIIHQHQALFVTSNDPVSLAILESPASYGADIVTGEGQCFGNSLNYGGPYLGILATREKFIRKVPGRIVGITEDKNGKRGFVLTFQTREQHIRRDKATSNICTNQALNALAATVYIALMGKNGLEKVATSCLKNSHYLANRLAEIKGFKLKFDKPFFKEFVLETPVQPREIIDVLLKDKIHAGIDVSGFDYGLNSSLLIAVTEKRSREQMDRFVELMNKF